MGKKRSKKHMHEVYRVWDWEGSQAILMLPIAGALLSMAIGLGTVLKEDPAFGYTLTGALFGGLLLWAFAAWANGQMYTSKEEA